MKKIMVIGCLEETLDTLTYFYSLGGKIDDLVTLSSQQAKKIGITNFVDLKPFARLHKIPIH